MSLDLEYVRRGGGEPLLLIHSLGGTTGMWAPVLDLLAESFDVVAVDMPGFGRSPSLPDGVEPSARNLAAAVLDFHDTLGFDSPPHVSGISLGGWVAIECGRQDRAASVTGLSTAGFWRGPLGPRRNTARTVARLVSPVAGLLMRSAGVRRRVFAGQIRNTDRLTPAQAAEIVRGYAWSPGYDESNALMRGDTIGDLSDVNVPLTLAWAEYDGLVRRKPLGGAPASVRQLVIPDAGHIPTWDAPELIAQTIRETAGAGAGALGSLGNPA